MRTRSLYPLLFAASLPFAAASCSDDLAPATESQGKTPIDVASLQGEELEKYAYGCEYYAEDTTEKVETSASEAYSAYVAELAAKSQETVGNKSLGSSDPLVGVIKVKTCGTYPQVDIYYDAEDKHNANEFDVIEVEYRDEQFDAFKDWRGESWRFCGMYKGIVNVDKNTTFRISKATY